MSSIIKSLLENDLYKFTMQQLVWRQFPHIDVRYEFINRGGTKFPKGFGTQLKQKIEDIGNLQITNDELAFFKQASPYLSRNYFEFLATYKPNPNHVEITQSGGDLRIVVEGPWHQTIWWETPLMATISEMESSITKPVPDVDWEDRAYNKGKYLTDRGISYACFSLRRRHSAYVQERFVEIQTINFLHKPEMQGGFVGTSNVHLAHKFNLKPIGTMAHELPMVLAIVYGFPSANRMLMHHWVKEFGGALGIALPDTYTTNVFLRDFERKSAMLFDGLRHDSGNPFDFTDKVVNHYKKLGIDPTTKTIVFSDSLNVQLAGRIAEYCKGKIKCSFGIGTNFSNDVGGTPLNIVIKVTAVKKPNWPWIPTVKLSDTPGKVSGNRLVAKAAQIMLQPNFTS